MAKKGGRKAILENNPNKCWDKNKCSETKKKQCKIFLNGSGNECIFNYCPLKDCEYGHKYGGCMKCPWFSKSNFMENVGKPEILNIIKS